MRLTDITHEQLLLQLDYNPETGYFTRKLDAGGGVKIGDIAGSPNFDGYVQIMVLGRMYRAHRLAWFYMYKTWPPNQIDHINRIREDNRISNLRCVSNLENSHNRSVHKNSTTNIAGVHFCKRSYCWVARIRVKGIRIFLGRFYSQESAAKARKDAEVKYGFTCG